MNSIYLNGRQTEPQENMLPLSAMYEDADGGRASVRTLQRKSTSKI